MTDSREFVRPITNLARHSSSRSLNRSKAKLITLYYGLLGGHDILWYKMKLKLRTAERHLSISVQSRSSMQVSYIFEKIKKISGWLCNNVYVESIVTSESHVNIGNRSFLFSTFRLAGQSVLPHFPTLRNPTTDTVVK